ncbi:MAG: nucleotidyltransferase domain-containing protein [Ktedonobacterales bacterium]
MLSAHEAVALCRLLEKHRIRFWVMGGWGVDALLHRETRPHKDLDILVALGDLPLLWKVLDEHGFTLQYVWEENRWLDGEPDRRPTAFVAADAQGRELDVHVIDFGRDGSITQYYNNPWPFPDAITTQGSIADAVVTCVSKETQLAMHTGYTLPDGQLQDLKLLQGD